MSRRPETALSLLLAAPLAGTLACVAPQVVAPKPFEFLHQQMGTDFHLVLYAKDGASAQAAADALFARLDELNAALSDYDDASELNRVSELARGDAPRDPIAISPALFDVLTRARELSERTGGAFDVTVGPLTRLWRRAARQGELPDKEQQERAFRSVGWKNFELVASPRSVRLRAPDMRFDLGGIAVGFALDDLGRMLRERGIASFLIDGGGDILVGAPPPQRATWHVAIRSLSSADTAPDLALEIANASVTTSGDTFKYVELGGVRYSHIVDPRTGKALRIPTGAAVVARDATTADALATAACVLGPSEAVRMFASIPGVEAHVVAAGAAPGDPEVKSESTGFARMLAASPQGAGSKP